MLMLAACFAGGTQASNEIHVSRSAAGMPVYTDAPRAGSTLLMALPARASVSRVGTVAFARGGSGGAPRRVDRVDPGLLSLIRQAAARHRLDVDLLMAVIRQESGFNPAAVSRAGARGVMQLMPATARRYGVTRIHDAGQNIAGGTAYLRDLLDRFGRIDLALAAYNAGEGAVERYGNRIPPYAETINYVSSVMADYRLRQQPR
jgi:soluble lytic murein transglycosylase-like protein